MTTYHLNEALRAQRVLTKIFESILMFLLFFTELSLHENIKVEAFQTTPTYFSSPHATYPCKCDDQRLLSDNIKNIFSDCLQKSFATQQVAKIRNDFINFPSRRASSFLPMSRSKVNEDDDMVPLWTSSFEEDGNDDFKSDIDSEESFENSDKMNMEQTTISLIEEQQRQIDLLMKMVQKQNDKSDDVSSKKTSTTMADPVGPETAIPKNNPSKIESKTSVGGVAPLKAMMFIDGTWLYYSIHERKGDKCPITPTYGRGWQQHYAVDWAALPRIVCEELQKQQISQGWSSAKSDNSIARPIDIVRASVYTSYKRSTDRNSLRARMFDEMNEANYDVHLMETLGSGEKCVDIQLAVEMLHYATVPNAYDVAIMLSGDKDFMPALIRTRQKGKQTAIVSMRTGCNRALYESPHVKDYDIVWVDDFLDRIIIPISEQSGISRQYTIASPSTTIKVIHDFISKSSESVSSRDIGRYLKTVIVDDKKSNLLVQLKDVYGGLRFFLSQYGNEVFEITDRDELVREKNDKSFWVGILDDAKEFEISEEERNSFSDEEKLFLQRYESSSNENDIDELSFYFTNESPGVTPSQTQDEEDWFDTDFEEKNFENLDENDLTNLELPHDLKEDYSVYTVAKLKDRCRERGLMVSGTKAVLLERVTDDVTEQIRELWEKDQSQQRIKHQNRQVEASNLIRMNKSRTPRAGGGNSRTATLENLTKAPRPYNGVKHVEFSVIKHLDGLVREYIQASGGQAGSRNLGRYLSCNTGSKGKNAFGQETALTELKNNFGSMKQYLLNRSDVFVMGPTDHTQPSDYGFPIRLR